MTLKYKLSGDLLEARTAREWKQPETAAKFGITLRQYQNIEGGKCIPQTVLFLQMVSYFELDIAYYMKMVRADMEKELGRRIGG